MIKSNQLLKEILKTRDRDGNQNSNLSSRIRSWSRENSTNITDFVDPWNETQGKLLFLIKLKH